MRRMIALFVLFLALYLLSGSIMISAAIVSLIAGIIMAKEIRSVMREGNGGFVILPYGVFAFFLFFVSFVCFACVIISVCAKTF